MTEISNLPELPKGWIWTNIEQIISDSLIGLDRRRALQSKIPKGNPYIKMNNVTTNGCIATDEIVYVTASQEEQEKYLLKEGDLLFNTRNSKELVGKTGIVKNIPKNSIYNNNLMRIRFIKGVNPDFICYQMCSPEFLHRMESVKRSTTNVAAIYAKDLLPLHIVFPPALEQKRIVDKIEELFKKINASVEELKKIKSHLILYNKSIIEVAIKGKLTENWRERHNSEIEPSSKLIEKIIEEKKRIIGKKYKELHFVGTSNLSKLPKNWIWATIRELSVLVTKGSTPTSYGFSYVSKGINFVKVKNIANGRIERQFIKEFITEETHNFLNRSKLAENDVLISIAGTIGRIGIVQYEDLPANTNQAIALIRCPWKFINPQYIKFVLESSIIQSMMSKRPRGVGMNNIGLEDVKNIKIPLPPIQEQQRIVQEIERYLPVIDETKVVIDINIKKVERLRQSVFKQAFEGKLVPQDPSDEPAEVMLKRIKNKSEEYEQMRLT